MDTRLWGTIWSSTSEASVSVALVRETENVRIGGGRKTDLDYCFGGRLAIFALLAALAFFLGGIKVDPLGTFSWLYLGLFLLALSLLFDPVIVGRFWRRQP